MNKTIRRAFAAGAITAIGFTGAIVPAHADATAPACDLVAIGAAVEAASTEARVAQEAFTTHTKTSMQALVKQVKTTEVREARAAARKAGQLARKASKLAGTRAAKEARAAAKAARATARSEAREAAKIGRASVARLHAIIKADRDRLKAEWTAAKVALHKLQAQAEDCTEDADTEEPVG